MLPRAATSKVSPGQQDARSRKSRIVERVALIAPVFILTDIVEQVFTKPIESYALHKPGWNDSIRIDLISWDINS